MVTATQDGSSLMQAAGVGTSFAAPHLAGALALLESVVPATRSEEHVVNEIKRSSWNLAPEESCVVDQTCGGGMLNVMSLLQYGQLVASGNYSSYNASNSTVWPLFNTGNQTNGRVTAAAASLCPFGMYDSTNWWDSYNDNHESMGSCPDREAVCKIDFSGTSGWFYGIKGYCCNINGELTGSTFVAYRGCSNCATYDYGITAGTGKFFSASRYQDLTKYAFYGVDGGLVASNWGDGADVSGYNYVNCGGGVMFGAHVGWGGAMDRLYLYCRYLCEFCPPGTSSSASVRGQSVSDCVACSVGKMSSAYAAVTSTTPYLRDATRWCQQGACGLIA